jgi:hypothetical protein
MSDNLSFTVCWSDTAFSDGPAYCDPECTIWSEFTSIIPAGRREGEKDGPNVIAARFALEPGRRQARRLKANVQARTMVVLDIETNKKTGEVPPEPDVAIARAKARGQACLLYTSHNHAPGDPRYRMMLPLSAEIAPELPAAEVTAEALGLLGVLDTSKVGAASLFYLPSLPYGGNLDRHTTVILPGNPIDAAWITDCAGAILASRQSEADHIAAEAQRGAAARRQAKLDAGFDPDDSLIEKLRSRFDLASILTGHGYDKAGSKYRHPNSASGSYGADIKVLGGIERIFSHNGADPLHAGNLPAWCGGVTALDAFDVVAVLDFGGDRNRAMRELAARFNLTKAAGRKALAVLLFRLIKRRATQAEIETAAFAEGRRLGLTRDEVCRVAVWVAGQATPEAP